MFLRNLFPQSNSKLENLVQFLFVHILILNLENAWQPNFNFKSYICLFICIMHFNDVE